MYNELLFSVDIEYQMQLNKDIISEYLITEFSNNKIRLSQNTHVIKSIEYSEWTIYDKDNEKTYYATKEQNRINIYKRIIEIGDIVIHEADKVLHEVKRDRKKPYKQQYKMLMVVLDVDEETAKTKYIDPEELNEVREEIDIIGHIQENFPGFFETISFREFQNKCRDRHEEHMRQIYINNFNRLLEPEDRQVYVEDSDFQKSALLLRDFNREYHK